MTDTLLVAQFEALSDFAEAVDAVDRADGPAARLRVAAERLHAWGFGQVLLVQRDKSLAPLHSAVAGAALSDQAPDALQPLPGVIWRQRLPVLVPFASGPWFFLPGSHPWVAREFWASPPEPTTMPGDWGALDLIVSLLTGAEGEPVGTAVLAGSCANRRPDRERCTELFALLRHLGTRLALDEIAHTSRKRATRLHCLQEAGASIARLTDEREIVRELARQVARITNPDGVVVAAADPAEDRCQILYRLAGGQESGIGDPFALGDGVFSRVSRSGLSFLAPDGDSASPTADAFWSPPEALDVIGELASEFGPPASVLAVPVISGIRLHAIVAVHSSARGCFCCEDEAAVSTLASQAASALANAKRQSEAERESRQSEALADVARAVGESLRPGEVLQLILRHAISLLQSRGACIALRQGDWLHVVAGVGEAKLFAGVHLPVDASLLGRVARDGAAMFSKAVAAEDGAYAPLQRIAPINNAVIAPLATVRGTIGSIAVINRDEPYTDADVRVLQRLADQVSVAIVNARLFDEVERATREWKVAFDSVATGLAVLDDSRQITRCNRKLMELCDRAHISEMLGSDFPRVLIGDSTVADENDVISRARREGREVRGELLHSRRGTVYRITASPHPAGGTMIAVDDVTEGHRLTERFQRVVETALDAIVITDNERVISFANSAAQTLLARSASLVGTPVRDVIAPESEPLVAARESAALSGVAQRYECMILRPDGTRRTVEVSTAPLMELGTISGTVACLRDVSEERAGASALMKAESRYTRLFEEATDAIFTFDRLGNFTSLNRSLELACGSSRVQLLGTPCMGLIDPRDQVKCAAMLRRTIEGERLQEDVRYPSASGHVSTGVLISAPIVEDGQIVGGLGIMRHIGDEQFGAD